MNNEQSNRLPVECDQCISAMINGVFCHESACPNQKRKWDEFSGVWDDYSVCRECDNDVWDGEVCCLA
jgi:hypothetical protein